MKIHGSITHDQKHLLENNGTSVTTDDGKVYLFLPFWVELGDVNEVENFSHFATMHSLDDLPEDLVKKIIAKRYEDK